MPFYRRDLRGSLPLSPAGSGRAPGAPTARTEPVRDSVARRPQCPDSAGGYAVLDLETTGLSPTKDSILEIGLVLVGADGAVERSWSTLVDPGAGVGVGPTFIHGIVTTDLDGAPPLAAIADLLVRDLAGRAVVAHNARFDVGFLSHALRALGRLERGWVVPRVCTMELARRYISTPSRRLVTCCEVAGVEIGRHHSALDDAHAAAGLLRHYMAVGGRRGQRSTAWSRALDEAAVFAGWHWDAGEARRQEALLLPRRGAGVPRTALPG
ncbi:MAG: 3'-5' exonuclease [Actinomyces sp.]|uniref:3'-5' exonuclease n=1 Tax=Actinomyces sp. TaxID=29317 RepID=UPI0026DC6AD4|nr:3'-5' exonuclease [Actinomyces sp.]MDO4243968.1 3'-5' exonuclease [Actinomyces sp.]